MLWAETSEKVAVFPAPHSIKNQYVQETLGNTRPFVRFRLLLVIDQNLLTRKLAQPRRLLFIAWFNCYVSNENYIKTISYSIYLFFMIFYVPCTLQVTANKPRSNANVFYLINLSICEINSIKHCFLITDCWKLHHSHPAPLTCTCWSSTVPQVKWFSSSEAKSQAAFVLICVFLLGVHSQS